MSAFTTIGPEMSAPKTFVPASVAPGPDNPGPVRFLSAMVNDPLTAIPESAYREPVTAMKVLGETVVVISDPAMVEEILVKRPQDFPKSKIDDKVFKPALGDGLLTAEGDDWKWKRRLVAPYFSPARLGRSLPNMVKPFEALAVEWRGRNSGAPVDITSAMTEATFEVISRTLFTNQDEIDFGTLSGAINDYLAPITWVIGFASLKVPSWIPHPGVSKLGRARNAMRGAVSDLIAARRRSGRQVADICGDLMRAKDPDTGRVLSDADLVDMLLTLVAAGHETSANGLSWALYCLASLPELQERVAAEVADAIGGRPVSYEEAAKLDVTEAFLKETMRLFPPAPLMARRTVKPERFGGHTFRAGVTIFIPIYAIHRHERLWESPEEFRIERFLNGGSKAFGRTAYMPFGCGPRICVGWAFALLEMKVALAVLLQKVRFSLADETRCEPVHRVTLRSKRGMRLKVGTA